MSFLMGFALFTMAYIVITMLVLAARDRFKLWVFTDLDLEGAATAARLERMKKPHPRQAEIDAEAARLLRETKENIHGN